MCTICGSTSRPVPPGSDQDYREARNPTARHDDVCGARDAGRVHDANGHCQARPPSCTHGVSGATIDPGRLEIFACQTFRLASSPFDHRPDKLHQRRPSVCESEHAALRDPNFLEESTWHSVNHVAGSGIRLRTTGQYPFFLPIGAVFLYARWASGSAWAITGRGLRRRNPRVRKRR